MLRSLFRNVAISAVAFFAVSVVGLVLVPILISNYGLAGFGHIAVARLFLPVAALAVLDFGFGEIATQAVARARADRDWQLSARMLTLVASAASLVGLAAGGALVASAPWIPEWMSVARADQPGLTRVLVITGIVLPVLFMSLVFEGVVKGFENFLAQRAVEVMGSLTYAALTAAMVWAGWDVNAVCYALLLSLGLRALVAATIALRSLHAHGVRPLRARPDDRYAFFSRSRVMAANKVLGASQTQLPPLLIGLLLGPVAVGTFDALSRLPRFAKGVLGILSSTVLPVATRLESAADDKGLRRLGQAGVLLIGLISLPPLAAAMIFSQPILTLWLGHELAPMWGWQAAMFVVPALGVLVGFGGTALLVRPHVVSAMNRLIAVQIVVQIAIALAATGWLRERAFILGQVIAVAITFAAQMRLICVELGVPTSAYWRLLRLFAVILALAAPGWLMVPTINGWAPLALASGLWIVVCWACCVLLVLSPGHRVRLWNAVRESMRKAGKE